jgi:hypothetical protein
MDIKKAQSAMEYVSIVGFIMIIMLPATYLYIKYSGDSSDSVTNAKIDVISNEIVSAAEQMYAYGAGSQTTIKINFPKGIQKVEFIENEIVFYVLNSGGGLNEIAKVSNVPLSGLLEVDVEGNKEIIVKSTGNGVYIANTCIEGKQLCSSCEGEYFCSYICLESMWNLIDYFDNDECMGVPLQHMECQNFICTIVQGPGTNECALPEDCMIHHECIDYQCVEVQGPGVEECTLDSQCIIIG